jgi:hypothetical protein
VLYLAADYMPLARFIPKLRQSEQRKIVAFRGTARKDDFMRLGVNYRSYLFAGSLNGTLGPRTELVGSAPCVSEILRKILQHKVFHTGVNRCGRVAVHVNG